MEWTSETPISFSGARQPERKEPPPTIAELVRDLEVSIGGLAEYRGREITYRRYIEDALNATGGEGVKQVHDVIERKTGEGSDLEQIQKDITEAADMGKLKKLREQLNNPGLDRTQKINLLEGAGTWYGTALQYLGETEEVLNNLQSSINSVATGASMARGGIENTDKPNDDYRVIGDMERSVEIYTDGTRREEREVYKVLSEEQIRWIHKLGLLREQLN